MSDLTYKKVKKLFDNEGALILFDDEDLLDWSAGDLSEEIRMTFTPYGVRVPQGYIDGIDRSFLYPYSELMLIAFDGFKFDQIKPRELVEVGRIKVYHINPTRQGIRAIRQICAEHKDEGRDVTHEHEEWFKKLAKGDLSWVIVGDPIQLYGVKFEWCKSGLTITQADGATCFVFNNADIYVGVT